MLSKVLCPHFKIGLENRHTNMNAVVHSCVSRQNLQADSLININYDKTLTDHGKTLL